MLELNDENVGNVLGAVIDPETGQSFLEAGRIADVRVVAEVLEFKLFLTADNLPQKPEIYKAFEAEAKQLAGVKGIEIHWDLWKQQAVQQGQAREHIKHIIMVASGKGGVGKSTVATNLAVSLAKQGHKTGLMDIDIYGPSIPTMMGVEGPAIVVGDRIVPMEAHGVKLVSMGFFVPEEEAVIWRGPMLHKAVTQFFDEVNWGELDFLVLDLPPGTGDIQLSLAQTAQIAGCVVVTTPQDVALKDVTKAFLMCRNDQINIPVLGIVENMTGEIFGEGGGKDFAKKYNTEFLGAVPMERVVVEAGDSGVPVCIGHPESAAAKAYSAIAEVVAKEAQANVQSGLESIPIKTD